MVGDIYSNGGGNVKPQVSPTVQILPPRRRRLAGPAHVEDWPKEARALRAHLRATHARCPSRPPKGGSDAVAMEAIEHIPLLDNQGLNLFRFLLSVTVKLSAR
jgi:hypothetical protein